MLRKSRWWCYGNGAKTQPKKIAASTPIKVPEIHGISPSKSHVGEWRMVKTSCPLAWLPFFLREIYWRNQETLTAVWCQNIIILAKLSNSFFCRLTANCRKSWISKSPFSKTFPVKVRYLSMVFRTFRSAETRLACTWSHWSHWAGYGCEKRWKNSWNNYMSCGQNYLSNLMPCTN